MKFHSDADAAAAKTRLGHPVARGAEITWIGNTIIVRQDHRAIPWELPRPEAFSDRHAPEHVRRLLPNYEPKETGRAAPVLRWRVTSSCAGYSRKASGAELYDALHAQQPTPRQEALVAMWTSEASDGEVLRGWAQGAYTFKELVAAMHRCGCTRNWQRNHFLRNHVE